MKLSLIVTTYNNPNYLEACLATILQQTRKDFEVIIADDGSGPPTRDLVAAFTRRSPVAVKHVWHEDTGYRLEAIRNKAIIASRGDYLVQVDGDMVLHPEFLADHARVATEDYFVCSSREYLSESETARFFALGRERYSFGAVTGGFLRKGPRQIRATWRSPFLADLFLNAYSDSSLKQVFGANLAFWRADAFAVNGFNEEMVGWGRDDNEFVQRLMNYGIKRRSLFFGGLAQHLYHPETTRAAFAGNFQRYEEAVTGKKSRCERGIADHLATSASG